MYREGATKILVAIAALIISTAASVNAEVKNTYSIYSIYGLGRIQTPGTLAMRSMGGAGVAMRSVSEINLLNPAAYSTTIPKSVLFDFGLEGSTTNATQTIAGEDVSSRFSTFNFHDIALQMPLGKGLGMAISVAPYSSVGYEFYNKEWLYDEGTKEPIAKVLESTYGSGEVTEAKFGVGWEITKGLSIGAAAQYYWGSIERNSVQSIYALKDNSSVRSDGLYDDYSISKIFGQVGMQWSMINQPRKILTLGATYDFGGDLNPRTVRNFGDYYNPISDTTYMQLIKPSQLTLGLSYQTNKLIAVADYSRNNWGDKNDLTEYTVEGIVIKYANTNTYRVGLEYTPRRGDIRHYHKRVAYRAGYKFNNHCYTYSGESINESTFTFGAGLPINMVGISKIDIGFEYGMLGALNTIQGTDVGLVRERIFKFSIGVTMFGNDYWFQRQMID